jgi:hypothetical protein
MTQSQFEDNAETLKSRVDTSHLPYVFEELTSFDNGLQKRISKQQVETRLYDYFSQC